MVPIPPFAMPMIGSNPYAVDGYKTIGYEIIEQLEWRVPDFVSVPVGGGDAAFWVLEGFQRMARPWVHRPCSTHDRRRGLWPDRDRVGQRAGLRAGCALGSYGRYLGGGLPEQLSGPQSGQGLAGVARRASDDEMMEMQQSLAAYEGIYAEASSVLSLAVVRNWFGRVSSRR